MGRLGLLRVRWRGFLGQAESGGEQQGQNGLENKAVADHVGHPFDIGVAYAKVSSAADPNFTHCSLHTHTHIFKGF